MLTSKKTGLLICLMFIACLHASDDAQSAVADKKSRSAILIEKARSFAQGACVSTGGMIVGAILSTAARDAKLIQCRHQGLMGTMLGGMAATVFDHYVFAKGDKNIVVRRCGNALPLIIASAINYNIYKGREEAVSMRNLMSSLDRQKLIDDVVVKKVGDGDEIKFSARNGQLALFADDASKKGLIEIAVKKLYPLNDASPYFGISFGPGYVIKIGKSYDMRLTQRLHEYVANDATYTSEDVYDYVIDQILRPHQTVEDICCKLSIKLLEWGIV